MAQFLEIAFSLPTVVFSVLLILVVLYWAIAMLGIFSVEMVEGLGEAAEGLGEAVEGLGEAADGLTEAAEALDDGRPGFLGKMGFGDIPRSITWSLIVFFAWLFNVLGSYYVPGYRELVVKGFAVAGLLGLASLGLAVVATGLAIQPLRRAVLAGAARSRQDIVGSICTLKTGHVDQGFGQAVLADGTLLQVRVRGKEGEIARGARLLIYEYDPQREVFYVTPSEESPA